MLPNAIIDLIQLKFERQLPEGFLHELQENALYTTLKKGEQLFSNQGRKNKTYVILTGSLVRFIVTPEGEERATMFHTESFFPMIANNSINGESSDLAYYFKANEDAGLMEFSQDFALQCIEKHPILARITFQNMIHYFQTHHLIQNHLIALSSIDFFRWFLRNNGAVFHRFQSQDIASFMGITPAWFSKLKRKINQK